jgi:hypothetical protein
MKRGLRNTVAAFLAASTFGAAPAQEVNELNTTPVQQQVNKANKQGVVEEKQKKNQGIKVNPNSGGLDFDYARMGANTNPIYFPKVRTWASQRRAAQKRRRAK